MTEYEYGVGMRGVEDFVHRFQMTKEEADAWIQSWVDDLPENATGKAVHLFYLIRRPIGEWEKA